MEELKEHTFPSDAEWFIVHIRKMCLAVYTLSDQDDEFLGLEGNHLQYLQETKSGFRKTTLGHR